MIPDAVRCRETIDQARSALCNGAQDVTASLDAVHAFTHAVDSALIEVFRRLVLNKFPQGACLMALGGYGRRELCPSSDIDLLIIPGTGSCLDAIAAAVRFFWDIGLSMGCVVRTLDECAAVLGQDIATDTAYLECRYLAGNATLYEALGKRIIRAYLKRRARHLLNELHETLHQSLFSPGNVLYRIEPDLKSGVCALRDVHRFFWSERLRSGRYQAENVELLTDFYAADSLHFVNCYAHLIRMRVQLHAVARQRIDILETRLQGPVARRLGFGDFGAGALLEHYYKTVRDIRLFLLQYLERNPPKSVWSTFHRHIGGLTVLPSVKLHQGILFSNDSMHQLTPEAIIEIFRAALACQATLSVALRNSLRVRLASYSPTDFRSQQISAGFAAILSHTGSVGHVIQLMHETGVLGRLIPQFEMLSCKVEYDSYHEYTVDQHILLALASVDTIKDDPSPLIRGLYSPARLKVVRLAVLLHDIGKALEGNHAQNGAVVAETTCEWLGASEEECSRIRLLVQLHLLLSDLSQRNTEPAELDDAAAAIGTAENLDDLLLITVVDIRSVGAKTWTAWKSFQLEHIYQNLKPRLAGKGEGEPGCDCVLSSYEERLLPLDREKHREWMHEVAGDTEIGLHVDCFPGFERLTVCGRDRARFLTDILGCITSEGYDILSARIFSTGEGKVLDIFYIAPPVIPKLSFEARMENIRRKWRHIAGGSTSADSLIAERLQKYPVPELRTVEAGRDPEVKIDNLTSSRHTVVKIRTHDNFGLVYTIARCMHTLGINIVSARLSTRSDLADDVFYIDRQGNKIHDEEELAWLYDEMMAALSRPFRP